MWALLFLFSVQLFALTESDSVFKELENEIPDFNHKIISHENSFSKVRETNKYLPPLKAVALDKILESGTAIGSIKAGIPLVRITDNKVFSAPKSIYIKYFLLEDEHGFKYLADTKNNLFFKVDSRYVSSLKADTALYDSPEEFNVVSSKTQTIEFDKNFNWNFELSFFTGLTQAYYIQDLFNQETQTLGMTNQIGLGLFTNWKYPILAGIVSHFNRSDYKLTSGDSAQYQSLSIGPQIKTQTFSTFDLNFRFQVQGRIGIYSHLVANLGENQTEFDFSSTDILASVEFPQKNSLGEFNYGIFINNQWLNIKNQTEIVKLRAANQVNLSFGLALTQVIE
jgi:hypothetical protein